MVECEGVAQGELMKKAQCSGEGEGSLMSSGLGVALAGADGRAAARLPLAPMVAEAARLAALLVELMERRWSRGSRGRRWSPRPCCTWRCSLS